MSLVELEEARSSHQTGMLSYFISAKSALPLAIQRLQRELSTAENIKDRLNRKAVQTSVSEAIQRLKMVKSLPNVGLAVFSGQLI